LRDRRAHSGCLLWRARRVGFPNDLVAVASRAIRSIGREPEFVAPSIVIPLFFFFFFVQTGALEGLVPETAQSEVELTEWLAPFCTGPRRATHGASRFLNALWLRTAFAKKPTDVGARAAVRDGYELGVSSPEERLVIHASSGGGKRRRLGDDVGSEMDRGRLWRLRHR
jgi:hypothetical protein